MLTTVYCCTACHIRGHFNFVRKNTTIFLSKSCSTDFSDRIKHRFFSNSEFTVWNQRWGVLQYIWKAPCLETEQLRIILMLLFQPVKPQWIWVNHAVKQEAILKAAQDLKNKSQTKAKQGTFHRFVWMSEKWSHKGRGSLRWFSENLWNISFRLSSARLRRLKWMRTCLQSKICAMTYKDPQQFWGSEEKHPWIVFLQPLYPSIVKEDAL